LNVLHIKIIGKCNLLSLAIRIRFIKYK
jgi:hypothetical protein